MKNLVSFETAKALKAAGFPQPEPEFGQFWYSLGNWKGQMHDVSGTLNTVTRECELLGDDKIVNVYVYGGYDDVAFFDSFKDRFVFAPTAEFILIQTFDGVFVSQWGVKDVLNLLKDPNLAAKNWLRLSATKK